MGRPAWRVLARRMEAAQSARDIRGRAPGELNVLLLLYSHDVHARWGGWCEGRRGFGCSEIDYQFSPLYRLAFWDP